MEARSMTDTGERQTNLVGVAQRLLRLSQLPEALADFNQALKLNPDNGGIHLGRGISNCIWATKPVPARIGGWPRTAARPMPLR